ncbi:ADP-ribosyltransferase [Streptomyces atroolivaceus]|uniref:ADP-ribosyltransferase n=1 Tax=Streptomyces atroolivaceus TaxID=66869 RepID=UPI00366802E4
MPDRNRQLDQAEADFAEAVALALTETADEFADAVQAADELVAARFSVGRIARMWNNRVTGLVRRLLGTSERAAVAAAEDVGGELPDGWDDLPGRYGDGRELPEDIAQYVTTTEHLLRAVGDRLAEATRAELAAGVAAGEDIEQLRARLRTAFNREGAHLGPVREHRIAQTEATRAWNTATLAAAEAATGPDRPVVKQWITRHDARVRTAHDQVDGQIRLLAEPFVVAGVEMQAPGDPTAPASLVIHCRCRLAVAPELQAAAFESQTSPGAAFSDARETPMGRLTPLTFHGTPGRPSYRKYHPSGRNKGQSRGLKRLPDGGVLGSDRFSEEDHLDALAAYNGREYSALNGVLRDGGETDAVTGPGHLEDVRRQISALTDLIDVQEPTSADTTLYRGMRVPRRQVFRLAEGDEFHDRGFLSTSADQSAAQGFAGNDERSVMFTIIAPAGSQMADMNRLRDSRSLEEEFLLPPGSTFRVRRVVRLDVEDEDDSGPAHYELELINGVLASGSPIRPDQRRAAPDLTAAASGFEERILWLPEHIVIDKRFKASTVTAAAGGHTGAMIALMPTVEDAERLVLNATGSEPAGELHLTLFYLGEGADWDEESRADLISLLRSRAPDLGEPIAARVFGANQWNADGDDPCWVWSVGDDRDRPQDAPTLDTARWTATYALEEMHRQPDLPTQHTPWQPHVCAAYTRSPSLLTAMNQRLGPIRFDRLRVAFAGEHTDIPLGREEEATTMDEDENLTTGPLAPRPWHNPDDTALAFENSETGDGRVFRPGSVYWSGAGPWPLQYADEMLMGHQGAELAGAIQNVDREGDRITGTGVLYPGRPAGADALMLLEEGAPLGVSVDLDDVSVEFVDRSPRDEAEEGAVVLLASLPSASLFRMSDGSWSVTATEERSFTACGDFLTRSAHTAQLITGPDGQVSAAAVQTAFAATGTLTAAAGDPDDQGQGTVVHRESSGDLLMRITRARLRGATLVAMPAYDQARIVLAEPEPAAQVEEDDEWWAAAGPSPAHLRVVQYVKSSPVPVGARDVARALTIKMETARGHLARAAKAGRIVRLAPGLYAGPSSEGPQDDTTASAWEDDESPAMQELVASAWTAMQDMPPMPAAWFREPTAEELPEGSGGVHYSGGRVWGWVAQAGVPHAGYPGKKITIDRLAREGLDFSHFLRAKFRLDDGSSIKVGAMTMNVGHDGDGAQCDDAVCQFDNSGTVGAIVTVGLSEGGLWFSGAGAPWLSDWDQAVFRTCQPSYHLRARQGGGWELRAVLDVPVPGHSSPLVAAVIERSNLALAASAAGAATFPDTEPDVSGQLPDNPADTSGHPPATDTRTASDQGGHRPDIVPDNRPDSVRTTHLASKDVDAVASALLSSVPFLDILVTALDRHHEQREAAKEEAAQLAASVIAPAREEIAAGHTTTEEGA